MQTWRRTSGRASRNTARRLSCLSPTKQRRGQVLDAVGDVSVRQKTSIDVRPTVDNAAEVPHAAAAALPCPAPLPANTSAMRPASGSIQRRTVSDETNARLPTIMIKPKVGMP